MSKTTEVVMDKQQEQLEQLDKEYQETLDKKK